MMMLLAYRFDFIFNTLGNVLYIFMIYFIWKAIYLGNEKLNGMTFNQVFIYIAFSTIILSFINTGVEWGLARNIQMGNIVFDLVKPLNYQLKVLFGSIGNAINKFISSAVPVLIVMLFIFQTDLKFWYNMLLFALSLLLSFIINFLICFMVGMLGFYTQSSWGISTCKNLVVSVLSGALIPLTFYPGVLRNIAHLLPFQAIINTPMLLLTSESMSNSTILNYFAIQIFWAGILIFASRITFSRLVNHLTVNGG
jgi:ABC-2 type transport system permease protein